MMRKLRPLWSLRQRSLKQHFRRIVLALFALTLSVVLANCGGSPKEAAPTTDAAAPAATGALVFGAGGQPVNLTPGNITDGNSIIVQKQIYNYLTGTAPGTTDPTPELATEWKASEDGRTWTFKLRQGVKFHDGTPFDAEAVVFNVNRWWDPEFEYGFRKEGNLFEIWTDLFGAFKGNKDSTLVSVKAVDASTVEFQLKEPFAAFPAAIGSGYFGIGSPTAMKEGKGSYGTPSGKAIGTGPFVFEEWRSGDRVTFSKYADYWEDGLPKADQLVMSFVEDPAARLAQLRAGTLDFTVDLTPDQLTELKSDSNLEAVFRPSLNVGYLALNPSYEPLSKVEVRQAIASAMNKPEIVKAFWGDLGETDGHFIPPSLKEYESPDVTDYKYDPKAAKAAIAAAGYPNGFPLDLWYMPVSRPYFPNPKPIAEAFSSELSQIGIKVNLQTKDWGAYLKDRNTAPGFQSFMLGWTGDYGDPDNFLYAHFGPGSTQDLGDYKDPELFAVLDKARTASDKSEREDLYKQADALIFKAALRIPIVHSQPLLAQRASVKGWTPSPLGSEAFTTVEKT